MSILQGEWCALCAATDDNHPRVRPRAPDASDRTPADPGGDGPMTIIDAPILDRLRPSRAPHVADTAQVPDSVPTEGRTLLVASTGGPPRAAHAAARADGRLRRRDGVGHLRRAPVPGRCCAGTPCTTSRTSSRATSRPPPRCCPRHAGSSGRATSRPWCRRGPASPCPLLPRRPGRGHPVLLHRECGAGRAARASPGASCPGSAGVRLHTQYPEWADERWTYVGSLFDAFEPGAPEAAPLAPDAAASRVVVTLGTMPEFGFRRAVEKLVRTLPEVCTPDAEVLWQVGASDLSGLPRRRPRADPGRRAPYRDRRGRPRHRPRWHRVRAHHAGLGPGAGCCCLAGRPSTSTSTTTRS